MRKISLYLLRNKSKGRSITIFSFRHRLQWATVN